MGFLLFVRYDILMLNKFRSLPDMLLPVKLNGIAGGGVAAGANGFGGPAAVNENGIVGSFANFGA